MMMTSKAIGLVAGLATVTTEAPGTDAPPSARVLVAPLVVAGDASGSTRERIEPRVRAGLQRSRVGLLPDEAAGCDVLDCFIDRARERGATHLVRAEIRVDDKIYDVRITAHDVRSGDERIEVHETCEVCGLAEVAELVDRQAAALGDRLVAWAPTPGVLAIRSDPAGASIALDGEPAGRSPLRLELEPGPHRVHASLPGHTSAERRVVARAGVHETWSVTLKPLPRAADDRRAPMRHAGWALLGIGTAAIVPGVVFLALDGRGYRSRCGTADRDAEGDCRFRWNTTVHGAALTAGGVALLATGVAMLVAARRRR